MKTEVLVPFVYLFALCVGVHGYSEIVKLYQDKFQNYNKLLRPVVNSSTVVSVWVYIDLYLLADFDSKSETLDTAIWQYLYWDDEMLTWNPEDYSGVTQIRVSQNDIWIPDFFPFNDLGVYDPRKYAEILPLKVNYNGSVTWSIPTFLHSSCPMDVTKFPYDVQKCRIPFSSWQYLDYEVDLVCSDDKIGTSYFHEHTQWKLAGTSCHRQNRNAFTELHFTLEFHRRHEFYVQTLILPNAVLLGVSGIIFFLPTECGERIGFGITLTLALTVNLMIVSEFVPETSKTIPLVCKYMLTSIVISIFSIVLSTLSIIAHFHHKRKIYELSPVGRNAKNSYQLSPLEPVSPSVATIETASTNSRSPQSSEHVLEADKRGKESISAMLETSVAKTYYIVGLIRYVDKFIGVIYILGTNLYSILFFAVVLDSTE